MEMTEPLIDLDKVKTLNLQGCQTRHIPTCSESVARQAPFAVLFQHRRNGVDVLVEYSRVRKRHDT